MRWVEVLLLVQGIVAVGFSSPAWAGTCALCRQALASGGNEGLIRGFYWSILLIAGMPLAILGVIAMRVWRARRAKQFRLSK
jgi:hypothetical protein